MTWFHGGGHYPKGGRERKEGSLGGIIALSGYLPLPRQLAASLTPAARATPLFMAHGRQDPVVPFALGERSRDRLLALGCRPDFHAYDMGYGLCPAEIRDLGQWLGGRFPPDDRA